MAGILLPKTTFEPLTFPETALFWPSVRRSGTFWTGSVTHPAGAARRHEHDRALAAEEDAREAVQIEAVWLESARQAKMDETEDLKARALEGEARIRELHERLTKIQAKLDALRLAKPPAETALPDTALVMTLMTNPGADIRTADALLLVAALLRDALSTGFCLAPALSPRRRYPRAQGGLQL